MIGDNELRLNQATMVQAVQEWLDKRMPDVKPKVISISLTSDSKSSYGSSVSFQVKLSNEESKS